MLYELCQLVKSSWECLDGLCLGKMDAECLMVL